MLKPAAMAALTAGVLLGLAGIAHGAGAVVDIEVSPSYTTMPVNGIQDFTVIGRDAQGNPVPLTSPQADGTGGTITLSQDPYAFHTTVSYEAGQQTGDFYFEIWDSSLSGPPGSVGAFWGSVDITVMQSVPSQLGRIEISPSATAMPLGATQEYAVTAWDQLGDPFSDFDSVEWLAGPGVGLMAPDAPQCDVTATEPGEHTLTCTVTSKNTTLVDTVPLTVCQPELSDIVVSPSDVTLEIDEQQVFTVTGKDQNGNPYGNFSATWSATGGTITSQGMYTAGTRPGRYQVIARAAGRSLVGTSEVSIPGVSCADPAVTITSQDVTCDPAADSVTYDPTNWPSDVPWSGAKGFAINATGQDGDYEYSITFRCPVEPESSTLFKLYMLMDWTPPVKLMDWTPYPYSVTGKNTIQLMLEVAAGELNASFVLIPEPAPNESDAMPETP